MSKLNSISKKILLYTQKMHVKRKMIALSIIVGFLVGLIAVIMKTLVFSIIEFLTGGFDVEYNNYQYLIFPAIGILATVLFIKFVLRRSVRDGVPNVLFSISKKQGIIDAHNTFSSMITAALTVGFGGSVGLEGPTVVTGAAYGSRISKLLGLNYKQTIAMLGFASAAAMSAIFKAPVAAIVFALEVILFDMTMSALVPLLFASITAALTSYFFLGQTVLYPFDVIEEFQLNQTVYYFGLGILTALISTYFIKIYVYTETLFDKLNSWMSKFFIGVSVLGLLIFLLPSLYGEGYEAVNSALKGDMNFVFDNGIFYGFKDNMIFGLLLLLGIILFKAIATSLTFKAGGVGGVFAPTLFMGTMTGLFFVKTLNFMGITHLPESNFAMVGMAGLLAGVVHAPLTAIFLIAEITGGYKLFVPLMIVASTSYAFTKWFSPRSIYTIQLKNRGEFISHHKDQATLSMMSIKELIESNFDCININSNLRDLVNVIADSHRNIYPVIDKDNKFYGMIILDQIRHIMFQPELYDNTSVASLMFMPSQTIDLNKDDMEDVARKFQHSGKYNLTVLDGEKYVGFVSRANVFSHYRDILKDLSEE